MELRVHGIGGTTAATMLGDRADAALVPVWPLGGGERSWVLRGDDRTIAAYHWAPLTSGSRWFALWPLALPFTLLNVAGFMHPRGRLGPVLRAVHHIQCLAVTAWFATTVLFAAQVLALSKGWAAPSGTALAVGTIAVVVLPSWSRRRWPAGAAPGLERGDPARGTLLDPAFFRTGRALWLLHAAVVAAVPTAIWWWQHGRDDETVASAAADAFVITGGAVMVLLVGLGLLTLVDRVVRPSGDRGAFAWTGRTGASVAIATALIGGLSVALLRVAVGSDALVGAPFALFDAYGWAVLAAVPALVLGVVHTLARRAPGELVLHAERLLPDPISWARARVAQLPRAVAFALGTMALVFVVVGAVVAWQRLPATRADWLELVGIGSGSTAADRIAESSYRVDDGAIARIAHWTIYGLFAAMFVNLVRSRAAPDALRRVGSVWDVLTFWPRTFHPFAVRPYTECAVDQLRELLFTDAPLAGGREDRAEPVTVLAHSQGTMLVVAALAPGRPPGAVAPRSSDVVHLVTAGSPLRSLYAPAFPAYVHDGVVEAVARSLAPDGERPPRWTNVFRFTDHVGRSILTPESQWHPDRGAPPGRPADHWWNEVVLANDVVGRDVALSDPERRQEAVRGHDGYWTDGRVREVVRR